MGLSRQCWAWLVYERGSHLHQALAMSTRAQLSSSGVALATNYPRGKPRGIQQPKEKAYAASREESDPTRLNTTVTSCALSCSIMRGRSLLSRGSPMPCWTAQRILGSCPTM